MVMQTKTADATVVPEVVLLLDEAKIPFFEGIEERKGKRVGRRLECVGYDLPRNYDPAGQSDAFLTIVARSNELLDGSGDPDPSQVTSGLIETYVRENPTRPPTLTESYVSSWPLSGGLGPRPCER